MTAFHKASSVRCSIASREGYLALAIIASYFILVPRVDHPSQDMVVGGAIGVGIAFGLALGGVRFGKGGGLIAAWVALVVLSLWLLLVLCASLVQWKQVLWYWSR